MHPRGVGYFRWRFHCFLTFFPFSWKFGVTKNNILTHLPRGNSFSEIDALSLGRFPGVPGTPRPWQCDTPSYRVPGFSPSGIYGVYTTNWVINMQPKATYHLLQEPEMLTEPSFPKIIPKKWHNNRVFVSVLMSMCENMKATNWWFVDVE